MTDTCNHVIIYILRFNLDLPDLPDEIMKIFIETFGCTANKADSDEIAARALSHGHTLSIAKDANVAIINSCGVKDAVEKKVIHRTRELLSRGIRVILCGCLPYIAEREMTKLENEGAEIVGLDKRKLDEILIALVRDEKQEKGEGQRSEEQRGRKGGSTDDGQLFQNVDIQNVGIVSRVFSSPIARVPLCSGCLSQCTFCATKLARGNIKSNDSADIIRWVEEAVCRGAKEIQLTGQDLGCYGIDNGSSLRTIVHAIEELEGDFKVRLGMFNPNYMNRFPREIFTSNKFYHFVHMPIQSGNDDVLRDMRRGYSAGKVIDFIHDLRDEFGNDNVTFWTDMIVGFPTEDDAAFKDSLEFVSNARPDVVNISRFWPRPKTEAAKLKQLPVAIVKKRTAEMTKQCKYVAVMRNRAHIGQTERVIVLEDGKKGTLKGRNESYKQVVIHNPVSRFKPIRIGETITVRILSASHTSLISSSIESTSL